MKQQLRKSLQEWLKAIVASLVLSTVMDASYAQDNIDLGTVAANVTGTFENIAKLITASSYVAGLGFAIGSILKFKAHKDNPQQITVGVPIALMFVAAALIFLPSMFNVAGYTLFGSGGGVSAGVGGITDF